MGGVSPRYHGQGAHTTAGLVDLIFEDDCDLTRRGSCPSFELNVDAGTGGLLDSKGPLLCFFNVSLLLDGLRKPVDFPSARTPAKSRSVRAEIATQSRIPAKLGTDLDGFNLDACGEAGNLLGVGG